VIPWYTYLFFACNFIKNLKDKDTTLKQNLLKIIILLRGISMEVRHVQYNFACFIWSVIQAASGLYPPTSMANIFGN
jgi:hypothetical protein